MRKKYLKDELSWWKTRAEEILNDRDFVVRERDELAEAMVDREEELYDARFVELDLRAQLADAKKEIAALKKAAKAAGIEVKKPVAKKKA